MEAMLGLRLLGGIETGEIIVQAGKEVEEKETNKLKRVSQSLMSNSSAMSSSSLPVPAPAQRGFT